MKRPLPPMPKALPPTPLDDKTARLRAARLAANKPQNHPPERQYPILTQESKMPFGKHKGRTIQTIINTEPSYITWLIENIPTVEFSDGVIEALEEATDPRAPPKAWESPRY
jgi:uncharacterized protein (DUF3820 family)